MKKRFILTLILMLFVLPITNADAQLWGIPQAVLDLLITDKSELYGNISHAEARIPGFQQQVDNSNRLIDELMPTWEYHFDNYTWYTEWMNTCIANRDYWGDRYYYCIAQADAATTSEAYYYWIAQRDIANQNWASASQDVINLQPSYRAARNQFKETDRKMSGYYYNRDYAQAFIDQLNTDIDGYASGIISIIDKQITAYEERGWDTTSLENEKTYVNTTYLSD